jgi:hypothetical protein
MRRDCLLRLDLERLFGHDIVSKLRIEANDAGEPVQPLRIISIDEQPSPALDPPDPMAGSQPEKRDGTPKDIRLSKEEWAKTYTADYIKREVEVGRTPTLTGLRQAAVNDRFSGAREALRAAFDNQYGVKRGRKKKSAE